MATFQLDVNGQEVEAVYRDADVERIFLPLIDRIARVATHNDLSIRCGAMEHRARRTIVLMSAPPGAGKSTLASVLVLLASKIPGAPRTQAVGMDGFHYPNSYLANHTMMRPGGCRVPLIQIKGAPETFDVDAFIAKVRETRESSDPVVWPVYSRCTHDVVADGEVIDAPVVIIEGNYLLLDEGPWRALDALCDFSLYLDAPEDMLRARLVERKVKGGLPRVEAERFVDASDLTNIRLVRTGSRLADARLLLDANGRIRQPYAAPALGFFDLDGTLTWDRHGVPHDQVAPTNAVADALRRFVKKGNIAVLCTGRPPGSVPSSIRCCPFAGAIMLAGGYVKFGGALIRCCGIPWELLEPVVDACVRERIPALFEAHDQNIVLSWPDVPSMFGDASKEPDVSELFARVRGSKVAKIVFDSSSISRLQSLHTHIERHFIVSDIGIGCHEMTIPGITKLDGMVAIWRALRQRGMFFGTVYAFGDSENDLSMLSAADVAVVMGNALPAARAHADYVTDAVQNDGVAAALDHFKLT